MARTKKNSLENPNRHRLRRFIAYGILLVISLSAIAFALNQLHQLWMRQCIVTNVGEQVEISDGKMIRGAVLAECFNITNGVNLATLDYDNLRKETLRRFPQIKSITVQRRLPDKLKIDFEEREPFARVGLRGKKDDMGRVVAIDGVIFRKYNGTGILPLIRESTNARTNPSERFSNRGLAALRLLKAVQSSDFSELNILEADISHRDYILVTFANGYVRAKIAWEHMDEDSTIGNANLMRKLRHLRDAMRVASNARMWNATMNDIHTEIGATP